jgi:putative addiction module component (TIGR02574 family)
MSLKSQSACSFHSMSITLEQIVEETRQLPPDVVAELVDRILVARHGGMESSVGESWKWETRRRVAEIESGQVTGVPGEQVSARLRKTLGR